MKARSFGFRCMTVSLFSALFCLYFAPNYTIQVSAEEIAQGKAECVIELSSGRVLYERNGDTRLPMASTTKILTAITAIELCDDLSKEIEIPESAVGIEGSSVYLKTGDIYTINELLYGLMLRSGNDCAVALAIHCSGSIEEFSTRMNERAQKAGALDSHFSNPHGLPHKNHYTTARDLSLITRYAMQNPIFQEIVGCKYFEARHWKNKNKLLFTYDEAIGVKTGYTKQAGRCLVSAAKKENMTLICTVLNCAPMYERSKALLEDAFLTYKLTPLITEGAELLVGKEKGVVKEIYYYPLAQGEEEQLEIRTFPAKKGREKSKILGQFGIYLSKRLLFSGNLYKL